MSKARQVDVSDVLEQEGIDPKRIGRYKINGDGVLTFILEPTATDAEKKREQQTSEEIAGRLSMGGAEL